MASQQVTVQALERELAEDERGLQIFQRLGNPSPATAPSGRSSAPAKVCEWRWTLDRMSQKAPCRQWQGHWRQMTTHRIARA